MLYSVFRLQREAACVLLAVSCIYACLLFTTSCCIRYAVFLFCSHRVAACVLLERPPSAPGNRRDAVTYSRVERDPGETASRDPTHKARRCEVGGLTLYSLNQLSKRNIFQNSKLILFSDARCDLFCSRATCSKSPLSIRNPRAQRSKSRLSVFRFHSRLCYHVKIFCCGSMTFC
jgi:hypothetical protein